MTQVATQITLSLAERVRDWSRQERDLAMALRGLQFPPLPTPAPVSLLPGESSLSVNLPSPLVNDSPVPWVEQSAEASAAYEVALPPAPAPRPAQVSATYAPSHTFEEPIAPYGVEATTPTAPEPLVEPLVPLAPAPLAGPFDEFIAAVTEPESALPAPVGPLPPPSRFMLRVSPVGQPHRATKRNYDYFEELNVRLAAQAAARQQGGQR